MHKHLRFACASGRATMQKAPALPNQAPAPETDQVAGAGNRWHATRRRGATSCSAGATVLHCAIT